MCRFRRKYSGGTDACIPIAIVSSPCDDSTNAVADAEDSNPYTHAYTGARADSYNQADTYTDANPHAYTNPWTRAYAYAKPFACADTGFFARHIPERRRTAQTPSGATTVRDRDTR